MPDIAGNSFGSATPLSLTTSVQSFSDLVTPLANDYYRFTLSNRSSVNLSLTGLSGDANVTLVNGAATTVLQSSTNTGNFSETINTVLDPGTYYIRVYTAPTATTVNYTLNVALSNNLLTDLLWQNSITGQNVIWQLNNAALSAFTTLSSGGDPAWTMQATGDFNKDGQSDIVWRNYSTGQNTIWWMNGVSYSTFTFIAPVTDLNWQIRGAGDFNGDGNVDLLWRNLATGQNVVWLMNGASLSRAAYLPAIQDSNWQIYGVGDFNGDRKPDLLWRNSVTGQDTIWLMNGTTLSSAVYLPQISDLNWQMTGTGDINQDGKTDILWRNYLTGQNTIWLMNGTSYSSVTFLPTVSDTNWRMLAPFIRTGNPTPIDLAGNTPTQALNLGSNLTGTASYTDTVGGLDTNDYYQFSLGTASTVNLALTGLTANLDFQLLDSNGNVRQNVVSNGASRAAIAATLAAGTYYVRVFPDLPGITSNYSLGVSVDNLPVLTVNNPLSVIEGFTANYNSSVLQVTDNDNTSTQLTYTLVNLPTNGTLLLNNTSLTVGSTFTQADIDAGNRLSYQHNGSETLSDSFSFNVADGSGGTLATNTVNINVTPFNDPPVLTVPSSQTIDQGINAAIYGISAADPDAGNGIETATVSANNGLLSLASTAGLTFSQGTGRQNSTIVFSGTLSAINNALTALIYRANSGFQGADTITVSINDNGNTGVGGAKSDTQTIDVTVTPVNQPPVVNLPATQTTREDTSLTIAGINITDPNGVGGNVTVSLSAVNGVLSLGSTAGITLVTGTGVQNRNIVFSGSLVAVNAALSNLAYLSDLNYNGTDTIIIEANDSVNAGTSGIPLSDTKNLTVNITPVNDAPVLTVPGTQIANENTNLRVNGISVSDVDAGNSLETVSLQVASGVLSLGSTTGITFSNGNGNQNSSMVFSGTLAALNNALSTLVYRGNTNFSGADTINISVSDNGNTGAGIALSDSKSITVNVLGINQPPVITLPAAPSATTNTNQAIPGISISDPDAGSGAEVVTIVATNGVLSIPTSGITLLQGTGTRNSRITFQGSLTAINSALTGLVYRSNPGFTGFESIIISVNDQGNSGIGSPLSDTRTLFVNVGGVANNPPTAGNDTYITARNTLLNVTGAGVLANDTDTDGPSPLSAILSGLPTQGTLSLSPTGSFIYNPNPGASGIDTFTYRANDGVASSNLATVTISITVPPNNPPIANADLFTLNQNTTFSSGNVLFNDTDVEDIRPATAQLIGGPSNALSFTLNPDGSFSYTPVLNYFGSDRFTYVAKDSGGLFSNTATVSLSIAAVNTPPVANPDSFTLTTGSTLNGSVLGNDTDTQDGRPGTATVVTGPARAATFSFNPDGTFTYVPTAGTTTDAFTYVAKDSGGLFSNTTTVDITVTPLPNTPPVSNPDSFTLTTGSTLNGSVLGNDTDTQDGRPGTATVITGPARAATFSFNPDGTFTYVPTAGTTTDAFTYVAEDSGGLFSNTTTVDITVTPAPNTPPVASPDSFTITTGGTLTNNVLTNDTDTQDGRPGTATVITGPARAATFSFNPDGTFTYVPTAGTTTDAFTYVAEDSGGLFSNTTTVDITVTPAPNTPPVASPDSFTITTGGTLTNNVLTNDTDTQDGRPGTATVITGPARAATFSFNPDGTFTYVPTAGTTTDAFTYVAEDSGGLFSNTTTVDITVTPAPNTPPVASPDSFTITTGGTLTNNVLTNDIDTQDGRPGTATVITGPVRAATFSFNPDGTFTYVPTAGTTTDAFTYVAEDSGGLFSNTTTVDITVTPAPNTPPVASPDSFTITTGGTLTNNVLTNDIDTQDGRPGTATVITGPVRAATFSFNPDGTFTYVPTAGTTTDSFTYVAEDSGGLFSNTTTVDITVTPPPNTAPIASPDSFTITTGGTLTNNVLTNDTDTQDGRPGTATVITGPARAATFSFNPDGTFTYVPTAGTTTDAFTYVAEDSGGLFSNTTTVDITVTSPPQAPVANADGVYRGLPGTPLTIAAPYGVLANDQDLNGLSLSAVTTVTTTSAGGTVTLSADGSFIYVPSAGLTNGTDTFTYQATDSSSLVSNPATVTISVGPDSPPIAQNDSNSSYITTPGTNLTIAAISGVLGNDSDVDGPTLSAVPTVTTTTGGGTVTLNADGSFVYRPQATIGVDTFTYRASDGLLTSNLATVSLTVSSGAPPSAIDDTNALYRTNPGVPLTITAFNGVLQNDSDPNGLPLRAVTTVTTTANNGTVTLNADGSFIYNPSASFTSGTDTFVYQATDGLAVSNPATVTLSVAAGVPPTVQNDPGYRTPAGTALSVNQLNSVLNNDVDNNGLTLRAISAVTTTSNGGTVTLNADGTFVYSPRVGFTNGSDTFTYQATDGVSTSGLATVTISVFTNSPPVVFDDLYNAVSNRPLTVGAPGVLANDTDPQGLPLSAVLLSPTNGNLQFNTDGSFVYTPNSGFTGRDFFTYQATDGLANSTRIGTVTISVASTSTLITNPDVYSVNQNNFLSVPYSSGTTTLNGVLSNDVDILPLSASLVTNPTLGSLALNSDGTFIYTPNPGVGGLTDTFVYRASDGLQSATATVTISIRNSSSPPTAVGDVFSVNANNALSVPLTQSVLRNDTDPEGDRLTTRLISQTANGTVTLNPNGSFTYQPNANFTGTDTFTYVDNDGINDSNLATVTITVGAVNNPPLINLPGSQVVSRNSNLTISSGLSISDPDAGNNPVLVTLTATNGSINLSTTSGLTVIDPGGDKSVVVSGSIASINAALTNLQYNPDLGYMGSDQINITVNDQGNTGLTGGPQTTTGSLAINVTSGAGGLVKDINQVTNSAGTGTNSSFPSNLVAAGNSLYFAANDGQNNVQLWRSDGTSAGTILVSVINPNGPSSPSNLTVIGNTLFFNANDGVTGTELWKTDLVSETTSLVKNINPFAGSSSPSNLVNFNGTLFFRANDGSGAAIWKSDGTSSGTVKVGSGYTAPGSLTVAGNTLFFSAGNASQIWKTDGTTTTLVKNLGVGGSISNLTAIGNVIFFTAKDSNGLELWRSDGTAAGTTRISDINSGAGDSSPSNLVNMGGTLYFFANNGTTSGLYRSTAAGVISQVPNLPAGIQSLSSLTISGSNLFFVVDVGTSTSPKRQLWKSNGVTASLVKDINPTGDAAPASLVDAGGTLFFTANDGTNRIWRSDGTAAGTIPVSGAFTNPPTSLTFTGGNLFFTADNTTSGTELYLL